MKSAKRFPDAEICAQMHDSTPEVMIFDSGEIIKDMDGQLSVAGYACPSPMSPELDPDYRFPLWSRDIVVWLADRKEPLYLFGPTDCGKSSCIRQIAWKLNYPVFEITAHSRLEFSEMVGHHTVENGSMRYEYGPLAMAMRKGGIFLLNEIDLLDPGTAAGLNSVLDGQPLTIAENMGEGIYPHPMFLFAATANSNGASDRTGLYQGVVPQNIAFMDRFFLVESAYMPESKELALITGRYGEKIPQETLVNMVRYANAVRRLFMGYEAEDMDVAIEVTFSTRTLLRWARFSLHYASVLVNPDEAITHALWRALLFRASAISRITLEELRQRIFG